MNDFNQRYLDFCKPFLEAITELYGTMMQVELKAGKPALDNGSSHSTGDVAAIMGINGVYKSNEGQKEFKGNLYITWSMDSYLKSASAMMMDEFKEYTDEIADVGMEICNITMGNAKSKLNEKGYFIEMSIPTSLKGKDIEYKVREGVTTIVTPLESSLGTVYVALNYEDS